MSTDQRTHEARITTVWGMACALTVASAIVAATHRSGGAANVGIGLVVLAIGAAKTGLILREFMEVRTAPRWLQWFAALWLGGLFGTIVVLYLR